MFWKEAVKSGCGKGRVVQFRYSTERSRIASHAINESTICQLLIISGFHHSSADLWTLLMEITVRIRSGTRNSCSVARAEWEYRQEPAVARAHQHATTHIALSTSNKRHVFATPVNGPISSGKDATLDVSRAVTFFGTNSLTILTLGPRWFTSIPSSVKVGEDFEMSFYN